MVAGWVAHRECAQCGFSAPEVEFSSMSIDEQGNPFLSSLDAAPERAATFCKGCADELLLGMDRDELVALLTPILLDVA